MSEKRTFEGILRNFMFRYWFLEGDGKDFYFDTMKDMGQYMFNGRENKRIRITIEEI
jgi:hypothetical protein